MTQANINSYSIRIDSGSPYAYESKIEVQCYNPSGTAHLYFYPDNAPLPENKYGSGTGQSWWAVHYHVHQIANLIRDLRNEKPIYFFFDEKSKYASIKTGQEPTGEEERVLDLAAWLDRHTALRDAIVWETPSGSQAYPSWSAERKAELQHAFDLVFAGNSIPLTDPPPNVANPGDNEHATTVLAEKHAWPLFLAYLARTLAVEAGNWVSWSINYYSSEALALLLSSRKMFRWQSRYNGYQIIQDEGRVIPAPPNLVLAFLINNDIFAHNRLETIGRLLNWCRHNLIHFSGGATTKNMEDQWQYRGYPPVTRIIEGTPFTGHPESGIQHRTAGCRGTTGFLRAVLRVVNIPVKAVIACGHAMPCFVSEEKYLTHGDDPYNRLTRATPPYPAKELLIDKSKYDSWFGSGVPDEDKCNNVGRSVRELAIEYLPDMLLEYRCTDIAAGNPPADSKVYDVFKENYSISELEAANLWTRLDQKIASFGGCEHIP